MFRRIVGLALSSAAVAALCTAYAGESSSAREALQALNDYIGGWKGSGTSERNRSAIWKETGDWSWRFKGKDAWLTLDLQNDKLFQGGELRYLPDTGHFQFTAMDREGKRLVFAGELKKNKLTLTRVDEGTKETHQLQMNTAGGGDRFIINYAIKPANRTLFNKEYQVALTREGVSFAAASRKAECIVTGGLGTMAVSYKGMTYYVCCSGCRDAFNENPEKFIKEYQARKKSGN
jgi:hypothetical protein